MTAPRNFARAAGQAGLLTLALALSAGAASAGEAQDRLFALEALRGVEPGETLVYDFARVGDFPADKLARIGDGEARLTVEAATGDRPATALVTMRGDGKVLGRFDPFPTGAGNPMFMVFMEETANGMAKLTGGSVFYIRNRIREALGAQDAVKEMTVAYAGRDVPARELTFQPFRGDKNAAKMGAAFADLTITFVMSDDVPGEFSRMRAVTGQGADGAPVMDLTLTLARVEEG